MSYNYSRRKSSIVNIGDIPMGGNYPIRIQSMVNTSTMDTDASVRQCKRLIDAGCDYVRITTPSIRDAENLAKIKKYLRQAGYSNPLVADVHFNPAIAEVAARIVEKVRINPGNYIDKKRFEKIEYNQSSYNLELERIHSKVLPLLVICKEYGTAIRIGVNHGSLSDRIMSRYGDTPEGMAESAMEFLRLFVEEGFHQTVISMKSSNTRIMVQSTRLLVKKMLEEKMFFPVHLGVTEAGEGEDGIIKSAVGIGTLLGEGIGDTIRVSLTGEPEPEIPVAKEIVRYFTQRLSHEHINSDLHLKYNPFDYQRRKSIQIEKTGGILPVKIVMGNLSESLVSYENNSSGNNLLLRPDGNSGKNYHDSPHIALTKFSSDDIYYSPELTDNNFTHISITFKTVNSIINKNLRGKILVLSSEHIHFAGEIMAILSLLQENDITNPVIIHRKYSESSDEDLQIKAACDFGPLLIDGLADGIWIENGGNSVTPNSIYQLSLNLLQASRLRMSKTEYISCPSCGRTMFDLKSTLSGIREHTSHLKHLKIGVMGCIVNGPGEMADADYGYVGSGQGKITLYRNREVIRKNIDENIAVKELVNLIKENGDWLEK
jgi:(E)-4-hydroxy-3-methylbut-2-enyl-diphosphate synthase